MRPEDGLLIAARAKDELAMTEAVFDGLRDALLAEICAAPFEAADTRNQVGMALKVLSTVRGVLTDAATRRRAEARAVIDYREELAKRGLAR